MPRLNLAPGKTAHYYALLAWNGMNKAEALNKVMEGSYQELDATTYASGSVNAAKEGIEKYLLNGQKLDEKYITGEAEDFSAYFAKTGEVIANKFKNEDEFCDAVVKILEEIHDSWVAGNAKKYNRDADKNDKRLYQHLPTALIGLEEVAKDLMFLAPILEQMGYNVGKMTEAEWGAFVPSKAVEKAYQRYVENYKTKNGIQNEADLENHLNGITETYSALQGEGVAKDRANYMKDSHRVKVLAGQVVAKNNEAFAKDQSQPE